MSPELVERIESLLDFITRPIYTQFRMLTLAKVTKLTRQAFKWGIVLVIGLVLLSTLMRIGTNIRNKYFPPAPPPPTVIFGKLPEPIFPKSVTDKKFSFTIDTLTGSLPTVPTQVKVYKTAESQPGLLSLERTRQKVAKLGFKKSERQVTPTVYQWEDNIGRIIKIDIVSSDFDITSNFYDNPQVLAAKDFPDEKGAIENAKKLLTDLALFSKDVDLERTKTSFFSIENSTLAQSSSRANSQIIKVSFVQKSVDNLPIVYPKKDSSLMNFLVSGIQEQNKVVEVDFFWRSISNQSSTYPIKTPEQALEDSENGEAYILSIGDTKKTEIAIKNVYLAYFMSRESSKFLYPVYVFEGDNSFTAYVLALTEEFIDNGMPSQ